MKSISSRKIFQLLKKCGKIKRRHEIVFSESPCIATENTEEHRNNFLKDSKAFSTGFYSVKICAIQWLKNSVPP
jgi:hypothetical protein